MPLKFTQNSVNKSSRLFPQLEEINSMRNPLTEGERHLVKFLDENLPQSWEIFVQPYFNGDRPDVVIFNPKVGITIFEVKDWNSGIYVKKGKAISFTKNGEEQIAQSPLSQVNKYRNNLIGLYEPEIGERVNQNKKFLWAFRTAVYFHKMNGNECRSLFVRNNNIFGRDNLCKENLKKIVPDAFRNQSFFMNSDWAKKIRFWLQPPFHSWEQGTEIRLTPEQKKHVEPSPNQHQRLKGVAGSGKTLVIAQRAANLASQGKKVLVVTYNITLWHYIKDNVSRAKKDFSWESIEFTYFHKLLKDLLNENGKTWIKKPYKEMTDAEHLHELVPNEVLSMLQSGQNAKNRKYDAILIDEGQDYSELWYKVLCELLTENNETLFVIDERQNIYSRNHSWVSKGMSGFQGRWRELNKSYRLPTPIIEVSNKFADKFFNGIGTQTLPSGIQQDLFDPKLIWKNLTQSEDILSLAHRAIYWLNTSLNVHPSDIVVLVPTHKEGWEFVEYFEKRNLKINHVFEDQEKQHYHKKNFWMGDSRLKICTIHSFKGWELKNIIVVTPKDDFTFDESKTDKLLYTAITRARENLIVFNRNSRYVNYGLSWKLNNLKIGKINDRV